MKFEIFSTSGTKPCAEAKQEGGKWYIIIFSLERLLKLAEKLNKEIIISPPFTIGEESYGWALEVYDVYREKPFVA